MSGELHEALAAYAHEAWSGWMKYMFARGSFNSDGAFHLGPDFVARWTRQMNMPYTELPESERQSDRDEAAKMLAIIKEQGFALLAGWEQAVEMWDKQRLDDS